ncbi:MAG: ribose-phosphate diphosphokinase, partial [Candidatus Latescibacterota bacterium]
MGSTASQAGSPAFITPEDLLRQQAAVAASPRGALLIAACRSGTYLARRVVRCYEGLLAIAGSAGRVGLVDDIDEAISGGGRPTAASPCGAGRVGLVDDIDFEFANGETCVRLLRHVSGCDVFLCQALCDPVAGRSVDQNYLALLIAARACREHGANHVTAVLPYLAYGRQDKPSEGKREPTTARLMADLSAAAGIDRLVAWHAHCGQLRGFYGAMPAHLLGPVGLFVAEFAAFRGRRDAIAVAPDAGASGLVTTFGRALDLACAIGSKHRPRTDEAEVWQVIGDFSGKRVAVVLDDELGT